jgi:hypothetical protein
MTVGKCRFLRLPNLENVFVGQNDDTFIYLIFHLKPNLTTIGISINVRNILNFACVNLQIAAYFIIKKPFI